MSQVEPDPHEGQMLDELYALVRYLYRKKLAKDIIAAFQDALAARTDPADRLDILHHWLDFYRAHKYRKMMRRRRATQQERMSPCSACGYPVSHRHHLWDIAIHGENQVTVQLCANCHELHHLVYNSLARDSAYSQKLVHHILFSMRLPPAVIEKILGWCRAIMRYEIENGWLEDHKTSDDWLEVKLHWSEYVRQAGSRAG